MFPLLVMSANLRKETKKRGRVRYNRMIKRILRNAAKKRTKGRRILSRQEVGRGFKSTRTRVWKIKRSKQKWVEVGHGVHNGVAWRILTHKGLRILDMSAHGLHLKTVGRPRQAAYYADLAAFIADFEGIDGWILAGDFNRKWKVIARYLGGRGVGEGVDGVIVSANLRVTLIRVIWDGKALGLTDHPAILAEVWLP